MAEPFKNRLDAAQVQRLADRVTEAHPPFPRDAFVAAAVAPLADLELMDRVRHLADTLWAHLPDDFAVAADILVRTLGPPVPPDAPDTADVDAGGLRGFPVLVLTRVVGAHGLDHFEPAMAALNAMTRRLSAEFDIRPFLEAHPERTLTRLTEWSTDPDPHVRRLVSEGTRPRLPWGRRLTAFVEDPRPGLGLLERLKDDPSPYVRRSVANHLNDICKDHPDVALAVGRRWLEDADDARRRVVKHGLRTLLKAAHPRALLLFGYDTPTLAPVDLRIAAQVRMGDALPFAFTLRSLADRPQRLRVEYVLHHRKKDGRLTPKVFQVADRALEPGDSVTYDRRHDFRTITTRKDHAGRHRLEVRVNGVALAGADFELQG